MKRKLCSILIAGLCLLISGCSESVPEEIPETTVPVPETETVPETAEVPATESEIIPETTEVPETESETTPETETESETQDSAEYEEERKIIEEIYLELEGELISPFRIWETDDEYHEYENEAVWMMADAEKFSQRILGTITSEEDLIAKARTAFIERMGTDWVEHFETDYVVKDGVKMKYERMYPPYGTQYFEQYDVWKIQPHLIMGTLEDGTFVASPGSMPYLLIRGSDGKILASTI